MDTIKQFITVGFSESLILQSENSSLNYLYINYSRENLSNNGCNIYTKTIVGNMQFVLLKTILMLKMA